MIQNTSQLTTMSIDTVESQLYTAQQVETITTQAVQYALQQVSALNLGNNIPQLSPTITVADAAKMIGISKPSMYELVRSEQIRSVRIGKKILISRQSLLDWVEGRRQ